MRQSRIAGEQLAARKEYERLLKSLDAESKQILSQHVDKLMQMIDGDGFSVIALRKLADELQREIHSMIKSKSVIAIDFAKKVKAADFKPYLGEVQRLLSARNVPVAAAKEIASLPRISPIFGGGMDKTLLDNVWYKVWPDALTVDDRIKLLSKKVIKYSEMTIKQGIAEGKSAANIARQLKQHFEVEGLERKAAFRLAAHTTNLSYQSAQAEISIQAKFVMGVRIVRGMYGNMDPGCPICDDHGGQNYKEYYKSDFGGRDMDMWVMANAPAYHVNCSCGVETIYEDAVTFVRKARAEYANKKTN